MKAIINDVDIRGVEKKNNAKGEPYLIVRFEDCTGKPCDVCDKDISREPYYKKGTVGDIYVNIETGKFTNIRVVDFKIKGE